MLLLYMWVLLCLAMGKVLSQHVSSSWPYALEAGPPTSRNSDFESDDESFLQVPAACSTSPDQEWTSNVELHLWVFRSTMSISNASFLLMKTPSYSFIL